MPMPITVTVTDLLTQETKDAFLALKEKNPAHTDEEHVKACVEEYMLRILNNYRLDNALAGVTSESTME